MTADAPSLSERLAAIDTLIAELEFALLDVEGAGHEAERAHREHAARVAREAAAVRRLQLIALAEARAGLLAARPQEMLVEGADA